MFGVVTGSVGALIGAVKGFVVGAIVGAVVQVISGLPVTMMIAIVSGVISAFDGYLMGSTRLRERVLVVEHNPEVSIYIGNKIQVLEIRR